MILSHRLVLILLLFASLNLAAQTDPEPNSIELIDAEAPLNSEEQLAAQYFQNKEYDKAAVHYEKLFQKNPIDYYYNNLLTCYLALKEGSKAEKLVKKQIKKVPYAYSYRVDLGYVKKELGEEAEAQKIFKQAISDLSPNSNHVFELAQAFINRKELDLALEAFEKGRKLLKGQYSFNFEIAQIYSQQGRTEAMINEYLDMLEIQEEYIQQVQNNLAPIYQAEEKEKQNILKAELIKRVQKSPDHTVFADMLIWIYLQEKDFSAAFIQAKALDKRRKEDGSRIMELAQTALSNNRYDVAIRCYQYVIEKGRESFYYIPARIELLQAQFKKITTSGYTEAELLELENNYLLTLDDLGRSASTAPLIKNLAHLYAFYLQNTEKAIQLLEETISLSRNNAKLVAECKLNLGDILLINDEVWEASLYYSQVDKDFKHDPLGDEAKFRNARLSYFIGDFKWAQAQLDVLKGSTSKLIANDALQLSLLISDNTTLDTNEVPLIMFSRAELLSFRNRDNEALITLDSIDHYFPGHSLADNILFRKAFIMEKLNKPDEAAGYYKQVVDAYGHDILADDALFKLAEIYHFKMPDVEKAKELYQRILSDYPGSLFTVEARKRFRELRGDKIN